MLAGGRGSGLKQLCPLISLCRQSLRLMQTEAEFLELPAPYGVGSRRRSMLMSRGSRPTGGMKGRFMRHSLRYPGRRDGPAFRRSGRIFSRWAPWGSWRAHLLLKCFAK
jgi:hypothetical protein